MAGNISFDVVSEFDRQELVNALDQVRREVATRYDFKGSKVSVDLGEKEVTVVTDSEMRAAAVQDLIGTKAVRAPHFINDLCLEFPGHIIVGLDAKDGKVAIDGWSKLSNHDVIDMAQRFERDGVNAIVYTDISRDGMMAGVNVEATAKLASEISIPVIASGGISSLEDIQALMKVADEGIMGVIIGRALYEGTVDLAEAQKLVDGG